MKGNDMQKEEKRKKKWEKHKTTFDWSGLLRFKWRNDKKANLHGLSASLSAKSFPW